MIVPSKPRPIVVTVFYGGTGYSIIVPAAADGEQHLQRFLAACASKFDLGIHGIQGLRRCSNSETYTEDPVVFCRGDKFELVLNARAEPADEVANRAVSSRGSCSNNVKRRGEDNAIGEASKLAERESHLIGARIIDGCDASTDSDAPEKGFSKGVGTGRGRKDRLRSTTGRRRRNANHDGYPVDGAPGIFTPCDADDVLESSEGSDGTHNLVGDAEKPSSRARGRGRGRSLTGRGTTGSSPTMPWLLRTRALELMKEAKVRGIYVPPLDENDQPSAAQNTKNINFRDSCRGNTKNVKARQRSATEDILKREIAQLERLLGDV